jgi:two-component SAPR family response regulator
MKNNTMTHHFIAEKNSIAVIVEDDVITSDAIDFFLSEHVETVKKFNNVNDAKEFLIKNASKVKIVLCDYYLEGGEKGSFLAKELKSLNKDVNFWMMTARMEDLCEENDPDLFFVDNYLDKPLDFAKIRELFNGEEAA